MGNNLHSYECGMKTSGYNNHLMLELRAFFVATTAVEMMDFVKKCSTGDHSKILQPIDEPRLQYREFLLLPNQAVVIHERFSQIFNCMYKILLDIPKVIVQIERNTFSTNFTCFP